MRYLMKYLQRVVLVSTLLIGGVVGVLVAPLPSEASLQSITISVDASAGGFGSTTDVTIPFDAVSGALVLDGVGCTAADAVNYNICYKIKTWEQDNSLLYGPAARQVQIMNAIGTDGVVQDARLLINDCAGSGCLEKMVLTGVRIVPSVTTWNSSLVKVTIAYRNKFDFNPNDTTLGDAASSYRLPLSITGVFKETAALCTAAATIGCPINDEMHMWGRGIFCTSALVADCPSGSTGIKNMDSTAPPTGGGGHRANVDRTTCTVRDSPLCRMYLNVGGPAVVVDVRFDKAQQGVDYPGFRCNNGLARTPVFNPLTNSFPSSTNGKRCTADITAFIEFKLFGPDTVNLDGSPRMIGGNCGTHKAPPCDCTGKKQCLDAIILGFVDDEVAKEKRVQFDIPDAIFCDKDTICNGTINNAIKLTPTPSILRSFPFTAIGPDVNNFVVTTGTNTASPFTDAFTGPGGTVRIIAPDYNSADWPRPDDNSFYQVDQIHVRSANGSTVIGTDVVVLSCPGGHKGPVIIHAIGKDDTLSITSHIHNSQSPPVVCPY